jgi:hypothetical protein
MPARNGDLEAVLGRVEVLGDPGSWELPEAYAGCAIAVLASIWSIGVRYQSVERVLERYRALRAGEGADADADTPADLVAAIERVGGPDAFAEAMQNRQRTSTRNGILKAEAVMLAAAHLRDAGIDAPPELVHATPATLDVVRARWVTVPGQGSGISLDAFLMVCGRPGVKADRMVRRFVAAALEAPSVSAERAGALVRDAARRIGVDERTLDYAIWRYESGSPLRTRGSGSASRRPGAGSARPA